jgi:hypothetical protein
MKTPAELLLWSLLAGVGAAGLTVLVRNAPGIRGLVAEAKKPWACNVCMPLYAVAAMLAVPIYQTGDWSYVMAYPAGYEVAYWTLQQMSRPPGPPQIPDSFFTDGEEET